MDEKRELIVDKFGVFLSKHSERIRVKYEGRVIEEVPLLHLSSVLITSRGVSLSSDVVEVCSERGIDIFFISGNGDVYCRLGGAAPVGTVKTRREQLLAFLDMRGVHLGKAFSEGKIQNQENLIRYFAKYRKFADREVFQALEEIAQKIRALRNMIPQLQAEKIEDARESLLSIEGRAASLYWEGMAFLVGEELGWPGRQGRGARDPLNSALNYGYAILYGQVEKAIVLSGLDPYAGFVHTDRSGKPSLVLDLIEEFRQQVVDKTVFGLLGKGSEIAVDAEGMLVDKTKRRLAEKLFEKLDTVERYEGMKQRVKTIILKQAQAIASYVRGDRPVYRPFVGSW
ncbi:MAG: CRISPR-associated endonuclease Cas1 [Brevinematales bacterium]